MTAYLGPLGGLVGFKCPTAVAISPDRPVSYRRTLGGRVKAQQGKLSRRAWSVEIGTATPGEIANLHALEMGVFGPPPWVWVDPWAQVTNMLTPEQSMPGALHPGTWAGDAVAGGSLLLPNGSPATQTLSSGGGNVTFGYTDTTSRRTPVLPGVPVTGAVYVSGSGTATLTLMWHNAAGAILSSSTATKALTGSLVRASITGTPPANAASAYLRVAGVAAAALPSITWTSDLADWSVGNGCNAVMVEGLSEAIQFAVRDNAGLRRSSLSFTLREVG